MSSMDPTNAIGLKPYFSIKKQTNGLINNGIDCSNPAVKDVSETLLLKCFINSLKNIPNENNNLKI